MVYNTYIYYTNQRNVDKYTLHWASGYENKKNQSTTPPIPRGPTGGIVTGIYFLQAAP